MKRIITDKTDIVRLADDIYEIKIYDRDLAELSLPGQFINIDCGGKTLLRRPLSICDCDNACVSTVFQVRGEGTRLLSELQKGFRADLLAPLGHGFTIDKRYKSIAAVGGGLGVYPLLYLMRKSSAADKTAFLGFRSQSCAVLTDRFATLSDTVVTSDDGSIGQKGFVTDAFRNSLETHKYDIIYTCGPLPMLRAVADIAANAGIKCEISAEERMSCGIGACLVCACATKYGDEFKYSHVCADGPVFDAQNIVWE